MEEEQVYSGWCRRKDQSRHVFCIFEKQDNYWILTESDCGILSCPFVDSCPMALQAQAFCQQTT